MTPERTTQDAGAGRPAGGQAPAFPVEFVSVICWDASFRENFDAVACALDQTLPAERYELIFVEYYERVNPQVAALLEGHPKASIAVMGHPHPGVQNQHRIGACVNEGIRRARGDLVVVPDADVLFERDFLEEVVRQHERCAELALYFYRIDEPPAEQPAERTIEAIRAVGSIQFPDNYGGCLSVRKRWLEAINGYEEHELWRGYSAAGLDMATRLKALGLAIKWHPGKYLYHGHHPGCHSPDPGSLVRTQRQHRIALERARRLETLPLRGLDPDRRPAWVPTTVAAAPPRRGVRGIVGGLARRVLARLLAGR